MFLSDNQSVFSEVVESVADDDFPVEVEEEISIVEDIVPSRALREALISLDEVDVLAMFRTRAVVMKSPPMFLRGAYKSALRFVLQEARDATVAENEQRKCRAWKLFLLAPRMLLFRKTRGGMIPKGQLQERFAQFRHGDWMDLLLQSRDVSEEATAVRSRRRRTQVDTVERRAERAQALVAMGEVSSGRAVLEGAPVAPGNEATLNSLRDESRRPPPLREPLPEHLVQHEAETLFRLDRDMFLRNLRCARRGAAAGPSGMTAEHLRPLLDSSREPDLLWELGQVFRESRHPD